VTWDSVSVVTRIASATSRRDSVSSTVRGSTAVDARFGSTWSTK
jgi:hypothetical protein